jgi:hypothetical protein
MNGSRMDREWIANESRLIPLFGFPTPGPNVSAERCEAAVATGGGAGDRSCTAGRTPKSILPIGRWPATWRNTRSASTGRSESDTSPAVTPPRPAWRGGPRLAGRSSTPVRRLHRVETDALGLCMNFASQPASPHSLHRASCSATQRIRRSAKLDDGDTVRGGELHDASSHNDRHDPTAGAHGQRSGIDLSPARRDRELVARPAAHLRTPFSEDAGQGGQLARGTHRVRRRRRDGPAARMYRDSGRRRTGRRIPPSIVSAGDFARCSFVSCR